MTRLLTILLPILSLQSIIVVAQENKDTLLTQDMSWFYSGGCYWYLKILPEDCWGRNFCPAFVERYNIKGMKELHGKNYFSLSFYRSSYDCVCSGYLHYHEEDSLHLSFLPPPSTYIGIREENGKYLVDKEEYMALLADNSYWSRIGDPTFIPYKETSDGELVLYDFTLQSGDTCCHRKGFDPVLVNSVDTIVLGDGRARRMQTLSNGYEIVEGIGCLNSPGWWLFYLNPHGSPIDFVRMVHFAKGINASTTILHRDFDTMVKEAIGDGGLFQEGTTWTFEGAPMSNLVASGSLPSFTDVYEVGGKELVNGSEFRKVSFYRQTNGDNSFSPNSYSYLPPNSDNPLTFHIRESMGEIYVDKQEYPYLMSKDSWLQNIGDSSFIPYRELISFLELYNFNYTNEGSPYSYDRNGYSIRVKEVQHITTGDGKNRQLVTLDNGLRLLEGFGCINSPGELMFYLNPLRAGLDFCVLTSLKQNGVTVFTQDFATLAGEEFLASHPIIEMEDIVGEDHSPHKGVYTIYGVKVSKDPTHIKQLPPGVYVVNSRKVVTK